MLSLSFYFEDVFFLSTGHESALKLSVIWIFFEISKNEIANRSTFNMMIYCGEIQEVGYLLFNKN